MPLLTDIVITFALAIAVLFLCHRLRVPAVVGLLLTGVIVGPFGLGVVKEVHEVETLAEIGVVLLLFAIGIEFSLRRLLEIRKAALVGGPLQVVLTALVTTLIAVQLGQPRGAAIFTGFLVALSSTAIVLKLTQESGEIDSPHGRTRLGILIFQDIIVVPMILVTPVLAGAPGGGGESFLALVAKGIAIILLVIASAKWLVPRLLYQVARTRSNELFLLSLIVLCFGVAWLTSRAGLSLALGAFLAGLIISESEYSHHALGNILPFRDVFTTFFFVSIGMMLDAGFLFRQFGFVLSATLGVFAVKALIAGGVTLMLGFPMRTAILVGLALGQIGEFSFILSKVGAEYGLLGGDNYQQFLAVTILTMAMTPFVMAPAPRLADGIIRLPFPEKLVAGSCPVPEARMPDRRDHLVIIGFGLNGANLARSARAAGIPYSIIEMNPDTVRQEQAKGEPICYGDATQETALHNANIRQARIAVVAISDPTATRRITEVARRLNPKLHLVVRTRYLKEMKPLRDLGADQVVPEEFETSVEIFARVLARYLVPRDEIEKLITEVRADGYAMFRSLSGDSAPGRDTSLKLPDIDISTFRVVPGSSLAGSSIAQTQMRKRYGVSIVAIQRGSELVYNPGADSVLEPDDLLYVLGSPAKIPEVVSTYCSPGGECPGTDQP